MKRIKLTQEQLIAYLKLVGFAGVDLVEDESESDITEDEFLSTIDSNRREVIEPALQQQIQTQIAGKAGSSLRSQLAKLTGMPRKELDAIHKDSDAIQAALEFKFQAKEGDDTGDKIADIIAQHEQELEALRNELTAEANQWREKYISRDIVAHIRNLMDKAPIPSKADKGVLAEDLRNYLSTKYDLSYDEARRAIAIYEKGKGNDKIPALTGGNKLVSLEDEMKAYFEPRNLWEIDMRGETPKREEQVPPKVVPPRGGPEVSRVKQSMDAFNEWIASQSEQPAS